MITVKLLLVSLLLMYLSMNLCSCNQPNLYLPDSACKHLNLIWKYNGLQHWQECTVCGFTTVKESHNYDNCNYGIYGDEGHCCICNICGYENDIQTHSLKQTCNETHHWWYCTECGYRETEKEHVFGEGDVCFECNYCRKPSGNTGLEIVEIANDPICEISSVTRKEGTNEFVFVLTSLKTEEDAQPTSIKWTAYYVDDDCEEHVINTNISNEYLFTLNVDKNSEEYKLVKNKYIYVLCEYGNEFGTSSVSDGIAGWKI